MLQKKHNKYVSKDEALAKLQRYCAYQDRCHQEVEKKLKDYGIWGEDLDDIVVELIRENFLNEERFARSYARGKFRIKRWGKTKITRELKFRKISKYCIKKAMEEIDQEEYKNELRKILAKKIKEYKNPKFYERKVKAARFAMMKGYESSMVWDIANQLEDDFKKENL